MYLLIAYLLQASTYFTVIVQTVIVQTVIVQTVNWN